MNGSLAIMMVLAAGCARAGEWELVWSDEFDRPGAPDPQKWRYEEGFVRNKELQYYTRDRRENARVEDGALVIEARRERMANSRHDPKAGEGDWAGRREQAEYTSASLTTQGVAAWAHGRVEVRAKLPTGRGLWPAIWLLGANIGEVGWPKCGEIDIMENVGFDPDWIHGTVHTASFNHVKGTQKGSKLSVPAPHAEFHVYAIEWDAKRIDFLVDGRKYFTFENDGSGVDSWPFDGRHFLILNIAVGGGGGRGEGR